MHMKKTIFILLGLAIVGGGAWLWREKAEVESLEPEVPAGVVIACDEKRAEMCAQVYAPVCATVNIQCIKAPCYPIRETFSNSCEACRNSLVPSYTAGACKDE